MTVVFERRTVRERRKFFPNGSCQRDGEQQRYNGKRRRCRDRCASWIALSLKGHTQALVHVYDATMNDRQKNADGDCK
jgi:hypothetical protein